MMEDALRTRLEEAALSHDTLSASPAWHFVFLEHEAVLEGMLELIPGAAFEGYTGAVLAFARAGDAASFADAAAALERMTLILKESMAPEFSEPVTVFMNASPKIPEALGVPERYLCVGAVLLKEGKSEPHEARRYDVFSVIRP